MTIHNKQWHNFAASEARALGDIISESTGSIISECPGDFIGIRRQNDDGSVSLVFDGRHRLTALLESGAPDFRAWSVPADMVRDYAIAPELIAGAAALLAKIIDEEEERQQ